MWKEGDHARNFTPSGSQHTEVLRATPCLWFTTHRDRCVPLHASGSQHTGSVACHSMPLVHNTQGALRATPCLWFTTHMDRCVPLYTSGSQHTGTVACHSIPLVHNTQEPLRATPYLWFTVHRKPLRATPYLWFTTHRDRCVPLYTSGSQHTGRVARKMLATWHYWPVYHDLSQLLKPNRVYRQLQKGNRIIDVRKPHRVSLYINNN